MTVAARRTASNELHALSIAEASDLMQRKALSPVELTQALLDRAALLDPKINAYLLATPDQALQQARQAEREIMAGKYRGAMHGIPYGAKDVFATAGIATTGHSKAYADFVPTADATAVARLRDAGAVLLGKLSTHECAHGGPSFDLPWPPARNPWNLARFTGRLFERVRRRRRCRLDARGTWHRYRRLHSHSRRAVRHRRAETDLWPGQPPRRHAEFVHLRPCGPADLDGRGLCHRLQVLAGHDEKDPGERSTRRTGLSGGADGRHQGLACRRAAPSARNGRAGSAGRRRGAGAGL